MLGDKHGGIILLRGALWRSVARVAGFICHSYAALVACMTFTMLSTAVPVDAVEVQSAGAPKSSANASPVKPKPSRDVPATLNSNAIQHMPSGFCVLD